MKKTGLILSCLFALLLAACGPKDPLPNQNDVIVGKGVFVLNEGNFGYANASLTFYDPAVDTVANSLFYRVNGAPIGDVGQSLAMVDGYLYIVVNNSNSIYKVNARTLVVDTTQPYMLNDFYSPRFMLPVASDKAYVSDIVGTKLWIVNPQDMTHTGTIDMGKSTETMVQFGRELYVTNWSRYYVQGMVNNTVQVVNVDNDMKVADIEVGFEPNGMVVDKNGFIWVLCEGDVNDGTVPSTLWKINPNTKASTLVVTYEKKAMNLAIDPTGSYLYYVYGGDWVNGGDLHRANVDQPEAEDNFVIPAEGKMFYKIALNPNNGDIYLSDAKTYTMNGTVYRYNSDGVLLGSFDAGICPGFMLFN